MTTIPLPLEAPRRPTHRRGAIVVVMVLGVFVVSAAVALTLPLLVAHG